MSTIDWIIVGAYLVASLVVGLYLSRRGSRSMAEFFVSGRSLPWWLAGTSMAATTFSIDTPLYVSGVVARQGIAGNWQWWSFAISHVLMVFVFARLWRRAEVITDAELIEIRYGGRPAAVLRAFRAFLFAVPINVVAMGYAMLAARKVVVALGFGAVLPPGLPGDVELWAVVAIVVFTLVYAGLAGLWGVVATDFFQFFLGLLGAFVVAVIALVDVGGLAALRDGLIERGLGDRLAFLPFAEVAQLSVGTFAAYIGIQWWAFRRSDGGGEFIQRLSASKDEAEAERGAWFFNILNYVVRTWPWVLVGLVALVVYPDALAPGTDPEAAYPRLMLDYLPAGILGLVVASLVAAFMSTVSTQINWGASYITNDLYQRFVHPGASQRELVWMGRIASVVLTALAGWVAFNAQDVGTIFTFIIAIGTGPGAVLILRWFWWRINAWAEIASMVAGLAIALFLYVPTIDWRGAGFLAAPLTALGAIAEPIAAYGPAGVLTVTAFGTAVVWLVVMLLTAPEPDEVLDRFYLRARPGGPGWRRQRERTGVAPLQDLSKDVWSTVFGIGFIFGAMFTLGGALLLRWGATAVSLAVAVVSGLLLQRVRRGPAAGS
ncbi:MAG TPA: sodium:solute symporter family protein [Longimicrobiales bacterium]